MEILLNTEESHLKLNPFKYRLKKLYLSIYIHFIYAALISLTVFSIIWVSVNTKNHQEKWFIAFELFLCICVIVDLALRIYLISICLFLKSILNIVDLVFTVISVVEIVIAIVDVVGAKINTYVALAILILRNIFMMVRILILIKRSLTSRRNTSLVIEDRRPPAESMETILESNRENIKYIYRARLDTLGEEDEIFEDSMNNKRSIWSGRVKRHRDSLEQQE